MGKPLQGVQEEEDNEKRGRTLERRKEREQCAVRCCVRKKTSGAVKRGGRRVGEMVRGERREGASECDREAQWKRERDCEGGEETVSHSASLSTSSEGLLSFLRLISALPHGLE